MSDQTNNFGSDGEADEPVTPIEPVTPRDPAASSEPESKPEVGDPEAKPETGGPEAKPEIGEPEPASQPAATPPPPTPRAQPQYGEYAPEGWEWKPEQDSGSLDAGAPDGSAQHPPAAGQSAANSSSYSGSDQHTTPSAMPPTTPLPQSGQSLGAAPLRGVPHNLGVSGSQTSTPAAPRQASSAPPTYQSPAAGQTQSSEQGRPGDPAPYRAHTPQPASPAAVHNQTGQGKLDHGQVAAQPRPRILDRTITIILLVVGAVGALNSAGSLFNIAAQVALTAEVFGLEEVVLPSWMNILSTAGAIAVLLLYALTLIYSIRRIRARRITFFVPLVAGVIALIITLVVSLTAFGSSPELIEKMSDPAALDEMLTYFRESQG